MEKGADTDAAPNHLIPFGRVPDGITQTSVGSVDMAEIRECNQKQIVPRNLGFCGEDAQNGQSSEQEIHIQDGESHDLSLCPKGSARNRMVGNLISEKLCGIFHANDVSPHPISLVVRPPMGFTAQLQHSQQEGLDDAEEDKGNSWDCGQSHCSATEILLTRVSINVVMLNVEFFRRRGLNKNGSQVKTSALWKRCVALFCQPNYHRARPELDSS
jgi:hypothetical protein